MAQHTTFGTYELLENILLNLPMLDISISRAVAKRWKALTERSLPLRKALFLACDAHKCLEMDLRLCHQNMDPNFPTLQRQDTDIIIIINPLFQERAWDALGRQNSTLEFAHKHMRVFYPTDSYQPYERDLFQLPRSHADHITSTNDSAWHNVYFSRPPCTAIYMILHNDIASDRYFEHGSTVVLRDCNEIMLGLLAETLAAMTKQLSVRKRREVKGAWFAFDMRKSAP